MLEDTGSGGEPTRRDYVKYGSTLAAGAAAAGCSDLLVSDQSSNGTPDGRGSYTVEMAPAGEVTFDSVPERWLPYDPGFADMGVALGQVDGMTGIGQIAEYDTSFYDQLSGVSVDRERIGENDLIEAEMDKELFYELENDVHIISPKFLTAVFEWTQDDIDEIASRVGPFIGNRIFRRSDTWHDHRYYTMYQAFGKMAELFQEQERYEAFTQFHDDYIASVQSRLPPADQRPNVLLVYEAENEPSEFSPYRIKDKGTNKKQWRDLGVGDALAGTDVENLSDENRTKLDYESLLQIDPEILLIRGHEQKSAAEFRETVVRYMEDHPVARELSAVQNSRVYRGGPLKQGPIHNLFLTERAARQVYPDEFGEVTDGERLFDRQRVADIINGEFDDE